MSKQASASVRAAMTIAGVKRQEVAQALGVSAQGVSDKLSRGRWSADELAKVAQACGLSLAMVDNAGRVVVAVLPADD
jgi:hypothetical protein